jgi:hypothetical protein
MKKEELDHIATSLNGLKDLPNSQLIEFMDKLTIEYENTKTYIINSTMHLDVVENLYNKILKEFEKRT